MIPDIPDHEIEVIFSRSSGPGGQNVNKTSTKVQVFWNINESTAFNEEQKKKIVEKYHNECLQAMNQETRSQPENKKRAVNRLNEMVQIALKEDKSRIATKPTFQSRIKRFMEKKHRSQVKSFRKKPSIDE